MDKKQKLLRLLKLEEIIQDGDTAIAKFLFSLEDKLDEVYNNIDEIQKEQGEPGEDGHTPTEEELLELIKPLIPEVENGKTPTKDELLALIKPLIPQVKDGKTPSKAELLEIIKPLIPKIDEDSVIQKAVKIVQDSLPSVDELIDNVEKRLPKLSEPIRDALELLKDEDRLDAKHIHGLDSYYNDTFKTFARKEDVHVISTNKPLSEMVDVNVQGLKVGQSLNWNGREWTPYFPTDKAVWGSISGTLSDQKDLKDALDGLQSEIDNLDASSWESDGTGFIKPKDDNKVKVEHIDGAVTNSDLDDYALDADVVKLTGNQSIDGIKTFTSSPVVPAPTTDFQTATKKYVDDSSTSPAGSDTQIQFNDDGEFGASADLRWDGDELEVTGAIALDNGSGTVILGRTDGNARGNGSLDIQATGTDAQVASGARAVALGRSATASATNSIAVGSGWSGATASGTSSIAIGSTPSATKSGSIAIGDQSTASGDNSVVLGALSTASGTNALAIGTSCNSTEPRAIAIGGNSRSENSIAIGSNVGTGLDNSIAIGNGSSILGTESFVLGYQTGAGGDGSISVGTQILSHHDNQVQFGKQDNYLAMFPDGVTFNNQNPLAGTHLTGKTLVTDTEEVGSELVTNGDFGDGETGWTFGTGWRVSNNIADKWTDGTGTLSQDVSISADTYYIIEFDIIYHVRLGTTLDVSLGGSSTKTIKPVSTFSSVATYRYKAVIKTTNTDDLIFTPSNTARLRIDNVSVKEITGGDIEALGSAKFGGDITAPSVSFDTTAEVEVTEGQLAWNDTDKTLDMGVDGVTLQLGQEMFIRVRNNTGSPLLDGRVVYASGAIGFRPTIAYAKGDTEATSRVLGVLTEDIANNEDGFVTTFGYVRQIKTNYTGTGIWGTTWVTGDKLWVSKTDAGVLTNVEPTAPHSSDLVATVGVVGAEGIGSILINIRRHQCLKELCDIDGTPLTTDGQILTWHETEQVFDFDKNINDYLRDDPTQMITSEQNRTVGDVDISYNGDFVENVTIGSRVITFTNDGYKYTKWEDTDYEWSPTYTDGRLTKLEVTDK
jgi:hypothetical protein